MGAHSCPKHRLQIHVILIILRINFDVVIRRVSYKPYSQPLNYRHCPPTVAVQALSPRHSKLCKGHRWRSLCSCSRSLRSRRRGQEHWQVCDDKRHQRHAHREVPGRARVLLVVLALAQPVLDAEYHGCPIERVGTVSIVALDMCECELCAASGHLAREARQGCAEGKCVCRSWTRPGRVLR